MKNTFLLRLSLGALTAALLACPQVPEPDPLEPAPSVLSFTTSASSVAAGTSVKLTWSVENATTVVIEELKLGAVSGVSELSGEVDVNISDDSLFVLTARNARGVSDSAVAAVRVGAAEGELLFTVLPGSIHAGQSATLAWSAPGANNVTITATPGGVIDLGGQGASGSLTVSPTTTTSYALTAGVRSATAEVTVLPTLISFAASSLSADAGSPVTLSWVTANATRVQLTQPGRGTLVDESDPALVASGSFTDTLPAVVDPGQLFPYQLVVTGPGATVTDSVVISIAGNPAVLTFEGPKYVREGADAGISLSWTTRDTDAVDLTANGVTIYRAPAGSILAGSVELAAPESDTTYVLKATTIRGGEATRSLAVDVVGLPTVTLTATPTSIAPNDPINVSWAGTNIRQVKVSTVGGPIFFSASDTTDTGALAAPISFVNDQVLRIEVDNGTGQTAVATAPISVSGGGVQFSVPPGSLRSGERVDLSWTGGVQLTGLPHDDVVVRTGSTGFEDITMTGTKIILSGDGAAKFSPVGFSAPFMGRLVGDEVWIAADGFMSFTPVGNGNYSSVALPAGKMEAWSIVPCWKDISPDGYWEVKQVPGGSVLIVQWDSLFQVKVFSTGQVDIEYLTNPSTCTGRGVRGASSDEGFQFTNTLAANLGLTLFGPRASPVSMVFTQDLPLLATATAGGIASAVRGEVGPVIRANELRIAEALVSPSPLVGPAGQWIELYNARNTPIDLTGWTLSPTDGGVAVALSGVLAPGAVVVAGASADAALNDDAGVTLTAAGFELGLDAGAVALGRNGPLSTLSWTTSTPGVSLVVDQGPYRFSTDTSSSVARAEFCVPTTGFGAQGQLGTPGTAQGCGFPYVLQQIRGGFFDISATGTRGVIPEATKDDSDFTLSLSAAPFTFFGSPFTTAVVSTNGWLAFDTAPVQSGVGINQFSDPWPKTDDVNGALVLFGADLIGRAADADIYYQRVGPNVDPAAAAAHWIIQWHHWSHFSSADGDELNFQAKLFDDGTIEYHFGGLLSISSSRYASGLHSMTWLENPAGTQALVVNTRSYNPGISSHSAFRFTPR